MKTEKNEVDVIVLVGDHLLEHPSLFEEDRQQVEQQLMSLQNSWDVLFAKIQNRMER